MPYPKSFWKRQKIKLKKAWVTKVDTDEKSITCDDDTKLSYDTLVFATGSKPNKFGWPGQDLHGCTGALLFARY